MKKFIQILLLIILINGFMINMAYSTISGSLDASGYKLLADYIYDFQKFSDVSDGKLCVYGNDDIVSSIIFRYSDVISLKDTTHVKKCKLIYIAEDQLRSLKSIVDDFNNQKIATISFIDNFLENEGTFYASIGRGGKIKLQLNPRVKTLGIKINPLVLNVINN